MNNFIKSLFLSVNEDYQEAKEDVSKQRQDTKERFANNLRTKLFFNDNEIKEVFAIIDKAFKNMDSISNSVDYKNYSFKSSQDMDNKLTAAQAEMMEEVGEKVKEIMKKKVARAKKYFNKE